MNFKGESRFDAALVADAGANPASSKFARVIEGLFEAYVPNNSDLSPSSNLVGCATVRKDVVALKADSVCAPPLPNGSMRVFHGAGTTDEENAGQHNNIASLPFSRLFGRCRRLAGSGGGKGLWPVVALKQTPPHYRRNPLNPYAEKEARLRPQHLFTFGGGDYSFANASEGFKGWGADEVALPRS